MKVVITAKQDPNWGTKHMHVVHQLIEVKWNIAFGQKGMNIFFKFYSQYTPIFVSKKQLDRRCELHIWKRHHMQPVPNKSSKGAVKILIHLEVIATANAWISPRGHYCRGRNWKETLDLFNDSQKPWGGELFSANKDCKFLVKTTQLFITTSCR